METKKKKNILEVEQQKERERERERERKRERNALLFVSALGGFITSPPEFSNLSVARRRWIARS